MNNLQKILDEKYPIEGENWITRKAHELYRKYFSEGYNARIAEEKSAGLTDREILERDYDPKRDHSDFHTIK